MFAWVDFSERCGVPVFLQLCSDDMVNVWCLFDKSSIPVRHDQVQRATIESHLSAIKYFNRISRGVELEKFIPYSIVLSKLLQYCLFTRQCKKPSRRAPARLVVHVSCPRNSDLFMAYRGSGHWAGFVEAFKLCSPRFRNACGNAVANSRVVLHATGRRGILDQ